MPIARAVKVAVVARQQRVELGPGVVRRDLRVAGELGLLGVDGLAARVDGEGGREVDPAGVAGEPVEGGPAGQRDRDHGHGDRDPDDRERGREPAGEGVAGAEDERDRQPDQQADPGQP